MYYCGYGGNALYVERTFSLSSKPDQTVASKNRARCLTVSPRSRARGGGAPLRMSSKTASASGSGARDAL